MDEQENYRINQLRAYMIEVLDELVTNKPNINANNLDISTGSYSLDKIPDVSVVESWITGVQRCQDTYSFRSRNSYSPDTLNNLKNIGFFEELEKLINSKNKKGILPSIENIESIECLNTGTQTSVDSDTAEFDIQIRTIYRRS